MNNNSVPSLFSKLPARPAQINDMVSKKKKQIFARNLKKLEEKDRLENLTTELEIIHQCTTGT